MAFSEETEFEPLARRLAAAFGERFGGFTCDPRFDPPLRVRLVSPSADDADLVHHLVAQTLGEGHPPWRLDHVSYGLTELEKALADVNRWRATDARGAAAAAFVDLDRNAVVLRARNPGAVAKKVRALGLGSALVIEEAVYQPLTVLGTDDDST